MIPVSSPKQIALQEGAMIIMLTNEQVIWLCVVAGFIPYFFKKQQIRGKLVLEIRALFWSVQYNNRQWIVRVPLIERLRHVIWIVLKQLREDVHSQE